MFLLSFRRRSSVDSELEWITQDCMLIAGVLCECGEGVFEWHLCMTFTRVPSSAYKGYDHLGSALNSGERDCFLWKWIWKKVWYWCFLYKTSEELERHLVWSLMKRTSSLSLILFCCCCWSLCRGHSSSFSSIFFFFLCHIPDLKYDADSLQTGKRDGREAIGELHSVWCLASHMTKILAPFVKH